MDTTGFICCMGDGWVMALIAVLLMSIEPPGWPFFWWKNLLGGFG